MLDTLHDGVFEKQFLSYLIEIEYCGYLFLDDIHLNSQMANFWNQINISKSDISIIGHGSGSGLVDFKKKNPLLIRDGVWPRIL